MKRGLILLIWALTPLITLAQSNPGDAIVGTWLTQKKDGKVQIYRQGNKYYGKLIWGNTMFEADGKTSKKDVKNKDHALRSRTLMNLVLLRDFEYEDGEWTDGEIYDPNNGSEYSCTMKLKGGKLHIRGYIGISLLGRTEIWDRID